MFRKARTYFFSQYLWTREGSIMEFIYERLFFFFNYLDYRFPGKNG